MKTAGILATAFCLASLVGSETNAGRMFGGNTYSPPKWCFCALVCAGFSNPPNVSHVPPGQSLAACPRLRDEVIYDNQAKCGCNMGAPNWSQQQPRGRSSPNH